MALKKFTHTFPIMNVLLECIEPLNPVQCIFICSNCYIKEYRFDFSPLHWHSMPAYYAGIYLMEALA